jgi:hypothetical protein
VSDFGGKHRRRTFRVSLELTTNQLTQGEDHRVRNLVTGARPFAFSLYESVVMQHSQVFGCISLFNSTGFRELVYWQRTVMKCLEKFQPAWLGEGVKKTCYSIQLLVRKRFGSAFGYIINRAYHD